MAIIVDRDTKLVVQGLTGSEGSFHGLRNRAYGTQVVAGVTPGKGGRELEGIPVYDTVAGAVGETGANTSMVFVPAPFAADAIYEAVDAGIDTVICIAEGLPAHEMLRIHAYITPKGVTMLGPNCPGALSPGKSNVGIIPAEIFAEGNIGLWSGALARAGFAINEVGTRPGTLYMLTTLATALLEAMPAEALPGAPSAESTASRPVSAGTSASGSVTSAVTTWSRSWITGSRSGSRTTAVTSCPASSACRTSCRPVPPVAPKTV